MYKLFDYSTVESIWYGSRSEINPENKRNKLKKEWHKNTFTLNSPQNDAF